MKYQDTDETKDSYDWQRLPDTATLVNELVGDFLNKCESAAELAARMRDETGTRFIDWVDHLAVPQSSELVERRSPPNPSFMIFVPPKVVIVIARFGDERNTFIRIKNLEKIIAQI